MYVNYRLDKATKSIELYFNYFNYLDSPYVKMEDGVTVKMDTMDGTYLKLADGEDGYLNIVA